MVRSLQDMQKLVRQVNEANGWFTSLRTFGDDIALLHSEVSEAFEAFRNWELEDVSVSTCVDKTGSDRHDALMSGIAPEHLCKPEGVGSELADILVRLLDTCERYKIDLEAEFDRKIEYNKTRGYRHGNKLI